MAAPSEPPAENDRNKPAAQPRRTRVIVFGPFRLFPARQLLLEGDNPVRIGSRALEILIVLTERAGEIVSKDMLIAQVWPNTAADENSLRVSMAGLRKALGDGQPGRRYLANIPGRGYRFVAPVRLSNLEGPSIQPGTAGSAHNLPMSQSPVFGRAELVDMLRHQIARQRLVTIVGPGGIGKTIVALAVSRALLPAYPHGVRFVDLAPVGDPRLISRALGIALERAADSDNTIARLAEFLENKQMLIVLDSCEHVVEAAAALAEQILSVALGVSILVTSREPLRAEGEQVYRLPPLEFPADSAGLIASEALAFPAIQLFVDRTAAVLDGFALNDRDASAASDICRKLDGIPLAIELAAARTDVFGVRQLAVLLDDRLRILNLGKRTAAPRHRSLTAALDWSYDFLPEGERLVLCRLSLFAGIFGLASAIPVAGCDDADVINAIANLVSKSLVLAETGGTTVQYRLLNTTRAYAFQKLSESGELEKYMGLHLQHQQADNDR
jgi:predicted ATPase/DNA-binding winged helix-turn-helix (wHTH) protein